MDFMAILDRYGWPTALLVAVGVGIWWFAKWARPHLDRLVDSHCEFVGTISTQSKKQTHLMRQQCGLMRSQRRQLDEIHKKVVGGSDTAT